MKFKSDKQRKAAFANMGNGKGVKKSKINDTRPKILFKQKTLDGKEITPIPKAEVNKIIPISVVFNDAETNDVDYKLTMQGTILYPNGFGGVIKQLGGKKLTDRQIEILGEVSGFEFDKDSGGVGERAQEFAQAKQKDNTYNYSSAIDSDLNYGFFEIGERQYMSFSTHIGGDVRGNYTENEVYDITDVKGDYGEPIPDVSYFLDPRMEFTFKFNGNTYYAPFDGGMSGFDIPSLIDGDNPNQEREIWDKFKDELYEKSGEWTEKHGVDRWKNRQFFEGT